jgi:hypothetical protein
LHIDFLSMFLGDVLVNISWASAAAALLHRRKVRIGLLGPLLCRRNR